MRFYGLVIGLLSTLMGVGGGLFANLLMTFYGRPIHQVVAHQIGARGADLDSRAIGYVYAGLAGVVRFPMLSRCKCRLRSATCR